MGSISKEKDVERSQGENTQLGYGASHRMWMLFLMLYLPCLSRATKKHSIPNQKLFMSTQNENIRLVQIQSESISLSECRQNKQNISFKQTLSYFNTVLFLSKLKTNSFPSSSSLTDGNYN